MQKTRKENKRVKGKRFLEKVQLEKKGEIKKNIKISVVKKKRKGKKIKK